MIQEDIIEEIHIGLDEISSRIPENNHTTIIFEKCKFTSLYISKGFRPNREIEQHLFDKLFEDRSRNLNSIFCLSNYNIRIFHLYINADIISIKLNNCIIEYLPSNGIQLIKTTFNINNLNIKYLDLFDNFMDRVLLSNSEISRIKTHKCKSKNFIVHSNVENTIIRDSEISEFKTTLNIDKFSITNSDIERCLLNGTIKSFSLKRKNERDNNYNYITHLSIGCNNTVIKLFNYSITEISLINDIEYLNLQIYDCSIKQFIARPLKTKESKINLHNNTIESFSFIKTDIPYLNIQDCNLTQVVFNKNNSHLRDVFWSNVDWPKKIHQYKSSNGSSAEIIRMLKIFAGKQQNKKQELEFLALEMKAIKENNSSQWHNNLKQKRTIFFSIINWLINPLIDLTEIFANSNSSFEDKVIFFLGRYTNNFGLSWLRPLAIYLISSYFIFIGITDYEFTLAWKCDIISSPLLYDFLVPKFSIQSIKSIVNGNSAQTNFIFLITKVFQGFLIYQFIRAFRRFYTK